MKPSINPELVYGRYPDELVSGMLAWAYRAGQMLMAEFKK